ncbi:MAG: D-alanyl-D-alanine carboxypeptidase [Caldilineaceae bacterium]|nr:D-alanyl-D-alanine carboxypeptidase [Caldilineaceae bacterium]
MSLILCGFGPPKLIDRELAPTQRLTVGELRAWADADDLEDVTATAFIVYDMAHDRAVFTRAAATPLAPASLTKLMTALLVFERADLDATVTIEARDLVGDASMGLAAGEEVTVTDLLWGLLVPSGNDAAMALARYMAGSAGDFIDLMNARAVELGLSHSHFVNPHGLDALGHMSSAADLLAITQKLWGYPLFRAMVGTASITQAGHALVNTNEWLTTFAGVTGVKTGTTDAAGECLIASVEREGRAVLLVVLGSEDRYGDAERLYAAYEAATSRQDLDGRELSILNRVYGNAGVWYMQPAGPTPDLSAYGRGGLELHGFRRLEPIVSSELEHGARVGLFEWRMGDEVVATQPLVAR